MPRAARLLPYLETIDANRWYTNRGELVNLLEARLGQRLGGGTANVISAASGTAAIEAAILATAGPATPNRPLALLPAYTFVATACAVERCGYVPYLLDVEPDTWALAAERLLRHPILARAGVVAATRLLIDQHFMQSAVSHSPLRNSQSARLSRSHHVRRTAEHRRP